ncbi:MAG: tripartite tricarboxylate transporter substrate binding protein [Deltaproteobacteria bacterium]|nr:tripartite tricarboxylate transporter substrate binding protein [Deltaproteobacteria bacterium]
MKRLSQLLSGCVCAVILLLGGHSAHGDSYPSKPIKLVVGFPPGATNDIVARIISEKLGAALGQPVVVENKPGANAIIATQFVAQAAPDGYTLSIGASGAMTFNPGLYDRLPYDPIKDFAPVIQLATFPLVLVVNPAVPAKTLKELIALAKSKPGTLFYGSGSTPFQVATELLKKQVGINITHVSYKGSGPAIAAGMSGEVSLVTSDGPAAVAQINAGTLRALAVTSPKRWPILPSIPTLTETGYHFEAVIWTGLFAPAGTPRPIIEKLHAELAKILKMTDVKERFRTVGLEPGGATPSEFSAILKADLDKWTRVARENNIKAE